MNVTGGATNVSTDFAMRLLTGGDATGLTITDFDLSYNRQGAAAVAKVDATALASAGAAHTDNAGIEIDPTNGPAKYRFDWPDAAFAAGAGYVTLTVKHTSCFTEHLRVQIDPEVSVTEWNGVKLATTNPLPNAAPDTSGGLATEDASGHLAVDVREWLGNAVTFGTGGPDVNVNAISDDTTAATNAEAFFDNTGFTASNSTIGTCTTNSDMRGTDSAFLAANAPTNFSDLSITATTGRVDVAAVAGTAQTANDNGADINAILVDTGTTIPAQISGLNDLSEAQVNAQVDTALSDIHLDHLLAVDYDPASKPGTATALLNELIESDSGVSRFTANALEQAPTGGSAPTAAAIADAVWDEAQVDHTTAGTFGETATEIASILADTNEMQSDNVPGLIAALNDISAADILTTALTEAYAADGSEPTLTQALYLIMQSLHEFSISGTTRTVKQLDGSTTAATFTLDDASDPTSTTRAT